jgi:hypothetical protein
MKNNYKTLIILDWDDTLFPTSWLVKMNIDLHSPNHRNHHYKKYFAKLDKLISRLLIICMQFGRVVIVTNALPTWISISTSVLPRTHKLTQYIKILSARDEYQCHSKNAYDWKIMAFKDELSNYLNYDVISKSTNQQIYNIISIGDAEYEYKALIDLYDWNKKHNKILKSIKLIKNPSLDILYDELDVLIDSMQKIAQEKVHMDLNFNQTSH